MAMRPFHIPEPAPSVTDDPEAQLQARARARSKALIGGSIEKRRANGTASTLTGNYLLDPIFRPEDEARLQAYCDPADPRPLVIEIGFQLGVFASAFCLQNPHVRFLGFEVRKKFCEDADARLQALGVTNALLALVDAREMLPRVAPPASIDELFVFFPDPWWKSRHIKKRLISADFLADAALRIKLGGRLLLKTDVLDYSTWAEAEMRNEPAFRTTRLQDPSAGLPHTLRERRCHFHKIPTHAVESRRVPCSDAYLDSSHPHLAPDAAAEKKAD